MTSLRRITPLRQRYLEDLELRNYSPKTQEVYVECVSLFARHFGKSTELLGPNEIRAYQLYLAHEKKAFWSRFNQTVCALRFLYRHTLHQDWIIQHIPFPRKESRSSFHLAVSRCFARPSAQPGVSAESGSTRPPLQRLDQTHHRSYPPPLCRSPDYAG